MQRHAVESLEARNLLAAGYLEMNLVSNQAGAALLQDPALNLPWGIAVAPAGGDFWISDAGNGKVTLYGGDVNGSPLSESPLVVSIPGGFPTADVFNNTGSSTDFTISSSNGSGPAQFLFASLDGKISAWNSTVSPDHAVQAARVHGAYFTGLAIGNNGSGNFLYAADFQNGKIDVFDGSFQPTSLSGSFNDPNLPSSYAPFNVQNIDGKLYVTYAVQQASPHHQGGGVFTPAATGGIVDVYDLDGNLLNRFATDGALNAPWGLAMAPAGFGQFGGDLLVGNFGDGRVSAFKADGTLDGQLNDAAGDPISIHHLLALSFGNGATAGDAGTLFFTADAASLSDGMAPSGNGIVLLDGSGSGSLREVGNASVDVAIGAITVDSSSGGAIFLAGNPSLSASQLNVVGAPGLTTHGHPSVNVGGAVNSGVASLADPLASLSAPALPSATFNAVNATGHTNLTLQPGLYNGGISVGDNSTVTLMPGVYYLQGGGVSVTGQGTLQGQGVTIYVASGGKGSTIKVSGHGVVNLTAASSGDLQSVALFLARGGSGGIQITGQGVVNLTGTLYAPSATIDVTGNGQLLLAGSAQNNISSQLIAADLNVSGNGDVNVGAVTPGPFSLFGSLQPARDTSPLSIVGATLTATEGLTFQGAVAAFTASAAAALAADFTATIDWGDGSSSTGTVAATGSGGYLISGHHAYAEEGAQNVVVTLHDDNGNTITVADAVQIADAPLLAAGNPILVSQGLSAAGVTVASFTDVGGADPASDYTATIDWGDGTTSTGTVSAANGTFNVVGSHTYAAAGQYPVKVTIEDEGGATATAHSVALLGSSDFDSDDQFVSDAFEDILERAVDRASLLFFVNALQHGLSRQQFASFLTHSDEFLDNKIRQDYRHFLGRDADHSGLNFWLSRLRGGMTDEQLEAQFIGSAEFFQHSGGTNKSWVDEMYFDLLGRLPDAQGEAYWIQVLSGGGARSNVALGFAGSSEREGAAVQDDYQTFLGRNAGSAEVANWVAAFRQGMTNEQVISGFVGSDEYFSHHGGHDNGNGNGNGNGKGH